MQGLNYMRNEVVKKLRGERKKLSNHITIPKKKYNFSVNDFVLKREVQW